MKIGILMTGLLSVVATATFAQKGELSNAQSELDKYITASQGGASSITATLANTSIANAKTSIDKAAANEKTAALPQTYALKAGVYSALALRDTVASTSAPLFSTAEEALKKAKDLDAKKENTKLIDYSSRNLAQYQLTKGVKEYQAQKFGDAYKSFDYYRSVMPEDTNAIYYTGLAAINSQNYPAAISNYNKLLTTNYSGKERIYQDLTSIYLSSKDTTNALKVATEAVSKYPNNADFRKREIEIELQSGKQKEVLDKITAAIAADPKNKSLYYYAGLTYSQTAEAAANDLKKATAANKAALQKTKEENFAKAAEMYKKALEIDPNYFEANLNLGYVLIAPAIDAYNAANKLPASKQKEYEAAIAKATGLFDAAGPYLKKAVEINPKSAEALGNLKTYYMGKKDNVHAAEVQKQIDALK